ncbi:MAG: amidohydrolase [Candidatus Eisenbacteria sp.]|nr:amidohydrolase [Candidatus Eisenbacteria bacterium]
MTRKTATRQAADLIALRRELHRHPEVSDQEARTAQRIHEFLQVFAPDEIITGLGGHGLLALFRGEQPGPGVLVRCELDALPIPEGRDAPHASQHAGVSHKCGHDGHMAIVSGLAPRLRQRPVRHGLVALLYQPAEETGRGAARVVGEPRLRALDLDYVFALHNIPGYPLGTFLYREGVFASASQGMTIDLEGATAHAAEPQKGRSPALAVAELIQLLSAAPQQAVSMHEAAKVTVIHVCVGEVAFGTTPGVGRLAATLRTYSDHTMKCLAEHCEGLAQRVACVHELGVCVNWCEEFPVTTSDPEALRIVTDAAGECGLRQERLTNPFAWSEDFGHLTRAYRGAMFGLGAGEKSPSLHHPDYEFPDELIEKGTALFETIIRRITD